MLKNKETLLGVWMYLRALFKAQIKNPSKNSLIKRISKISPTPTTKKPISSMSDLQKNKPP